MLKSFTKICTINPYSKIAVIIFLILLIILCSICLSGNSKYSCDNGLFLDHSELKNFLDDSTSTSHDKIAKMKNMSDCVNKAFDNDKKHQFSGVSNCFNKYEYGECVDNSAWSIILIIIIIVTAIFLLLKSTCFVYDLQKG